MYLLCQNHTTFATDIEVRSLFIFLHLGDVEFDSTVDLLVVLFLLLGNWHVLEVN